MIIVHANPEDWKKDCYIASKLNPNTPKYDSEGNIIVEYNTPKLYKFNYQYVSSQADLVEFGEKASSTIKAIIPIEYKDIFKEYDVAYLDGKTPNGEIHNGDNANYRLLKPRNGNSVIMIYFEQLTGK